MKALSAVAEPRWTGKDSVCLGLAVFVAINVLMCLWVAMASMSIAHRQATAVFTAVANASTISFKLRLNTKSTLTERVNVTGQLWPHYSKCYQRLYFDGRMVVTSTNASEVFVLTNHRGYRWPVESSTTNATCLAPQDIPPLHTLADTVHSAFWPQHYADYHVQCKPLQFTFYDTPFVMCAEEWLRARVQMTPVTNGSAELQGTTSVLVIHGRQLMLELTMLPGSETPMDTDPPFQKINRCECLDAPMTSGEVCSFWPMHYLGSLHTDRET